MIEIWPSKRVLFVGYGRAGKDEAAQFAESHLGLRYGGSFSWHAKEDVAVALGVHPMTAWETRRQHRKFWYDECNRLRANDITILAKRALASGDIVAGLRDKPELDAVVAQGLFDAIVWVDRDVPVDPTVTFTKQDVLDAGGTVIDNRGSLPEYHLKLILFFRDHLLVPVRLSGYAQNLLNEN